jgi:8-oxo-dGTP pyrophosphatase MutT (NUDIX family)
MDDTRRTKKNKPNMYCINCNEYTHKPKNCPHPITSTGIILTNVNFNLDHGAEHKSQHIYSSGDDTIYESKTVIKNDPNVLRMVSDVLNGIKFLMVSRKHSLGYVEFIRGRYEVSNIEYVISLFKQMTHEEIGKISDSMSMNDKDGFMYLWNDLWKTSSKSFDNQAKNKYLTLKHIGVDGPEIGLVFIVNKVEPEYNGKEWGFPKGRRQQYESDLDCAIREFEEETGYDKEDIKIVNIDPIVEILTGTNGKKYRHIYYVAELITDKAPENNITLSQINEIGDICFMNQTEATASLRPYHVEKQLIVKSLQLYYFDKVYEHIMEEYMMDDE